MSDLERIRLLLSDPLLTECDIDLFKRQAESEIPTPAPDFPSRPLSRGFLDRKTPSEMADQATPSSV
jgi:hypothetical protein